MAPMKGLNQFIVDLRNSKDVDEENRRINMELTNIRGKFKADNLNGYQKKKYICKLIYIYLLGNPEVIDFGLKEAYQLVESNNFQEKQLGYLCVSVLVNYNKLTHDSVKQYLNHVMTLMYHHIVKDLNSDNEDFNCLALQFIASAFNIDELTTEDMSSIQIKEKDANSENWLQLIDIVYSYSTSPIKEALIKKKSSIALLTLLKLYPDVILANNNWIPRLLHLIDDKDLGVVTSSIPLIQFVITLKPQYMKSIIPSILNILVSIVVNNNCPEEYYYFKSPAPWLIVKSLQLIEFFFLLTDPKNDDLPILMINDLDKPTLENIRLVVAKSILNASQQIKGLPNRNSQSSILFQAVSLAVFLDASSNAIHGAINALMMLLDSSETNTRYLALDALIKLTARSTSSFNHNNDKLDGNLPVIFHLLYDKDISVRRKALDLLYTICSAQSYTNIINKLLDLFPFADFSLKSELAIKVAVLAEKFATDSTWYVTTMLKLLSIGGGSNSNGISYISNEVWERIVQIVVNNDELQIKTCKLIISLLKVPHEQSHHKHPQGKSAPVSIGLSENLVKVAAFILGEFGHLVSDQKDFSPMSQFQLLYEAYFKVSLVTRAMLISAYFKFVIKFPDEMFVPDIVDLFEIESQSIDLEIQTRSIEYFKLITGTGNNALAQALIKPLPIFTNQESPLMNRIGSVSRILGNSRNRSKTMVAAKNIVKVGNIDEENPFEEQAEEAVEKVALSPNWYAGYHRMLHYDAGIFFENQLIKITYRLLKERNVFTLKFVIFNNSAKTAGTDITGFKILEFQSKTSSEDPNYLLNIKQVPGSTISEKSSMELEIKIRNVVENEESPILTLSFTCGGSFNHLNLKVPVVLLKTLSSATLNSVDEFNKRWLQIGELLGTQEGEYSTNVNITHRYNSSNIVRLLTRLGFSVVHSTNDEIEDGILVMGGGILYTQKSNYGVLTRIQSVDSVGKEFAITVRCTGGGIPEIIALSLKEIFEGKF